MIVYANARQALVKALKCYASTLHGINNNEHNKIYTQQREDIKVR